MTKEKAIAYANKVIELGLNDETQAFCEIAVKALKQEPKKGKWTNGDSICPCCGEDKFKGLDADIWADWQPNFCPNCGAKMS